MDTISYSLSAIPDSIASGKKLYTAHVQTNGTLDKEEIVADLAASAAATVRASRSRPPSRNSRTSPSRRVKP